MARASSTSFCDMRGLAWRGRISCSVAIGKRHQHGLERNSYMCGPMCCDGGMALISLPEAQFLQRFQAPRYVERDTENAKRRAKRLDRRCPNRSTNARYA